MIYEPNINVNRLVGCYLVMPYGFAMHPSLQDLVVIAATTPNLTMMSLDAVLISGYDPKYPPRWPPPGWRGRYSLSTVTV
jgi:hypothetical protein